MGIRSRLLIAFAPLLLFGLLSLIFWPISAQQVDRAVQERLALIDNIIDVQELLTLLVVENGQLERYVASEASTALDEFLVTSGRANQTIRELLTRRETLSSTNLELVLDYTTLVQRQQQVVDLALSGNFAAARERFAQPDIREFLGEIVRRAERVSANNRAALDRFDQQVQAIQNRFFLVIFGSLFLGLGLAITIALSQVLPLGLQLRKLTEETQQATADEAFGELSVVRGARELRQLRDAFQQLIEANRARRDQIAASLGEIQARVEREARLRTTVQALSVPVIPLGTATLMLPIIGELDSERAAAINATLLNAIRTQRARHVLLDLTGLATISAKTAALLRNTMQAARLLGCRITLAGVRAEHAPLLAESDLHDVDVIRDVPAFLAQRETLPR